MAAIGRRAARLARLRVVAPPGADAEAPGDEIDEAPADEPAVSQGLTRCSRRRRAPRTRSRLRPCSRRSSRPARTALYSPEAFERIARFVAEIRRLRRLVGQPLVDLVTEVIAATGLDVEIEAGDAALARARLANIHAFLDVAAQFNGIDGEADLVAFLAYLRGGRGERTTASTSARYRTPTPSS